MDTASDTVWVGRRTLLPIRAPAIPSDDVPPPTNPGTRPSGKQTTAPKNLRTRAPAKPTQATRNLRARAPAKQAPAPKNSRARASNPSNRRQLESEPHFTRVFSSDLHERRTVCERCTRTPLECFYYKGKINARCNKCNRDHRTCSEQNSVRAKGKNTATSKQVVDTRVETEGRDVESEDETDQLEDDDIRVERGIVQLAGRSDEGQGGDDDESSDEDDDIRVERGGVQLTGKGAEDQGGDDDESSDKDDGRDEDSDEDGSSDEEGSSSEDGDSGEEGGSGDDEGNPDHQGGDENNHEEAETTTPTAPPAASGPKRPRTDSLDNACIPKHLPVIVKSDKKEEPDIFPLKRSRTSSAFIPLPVNPFEEQARNAERIDHLNTSTKLCIQSIHSVRATALNYRMQRTIVESHLDAIFATLNAIEANSTDGLTGTQIDQFKATRNEFLDVLNEHRPVDFRSVRVRDVLDKIAAKLRR